MDDRREAARIRQELVDAAQRAESVRARVIVDAFVAEARRRGLPTVPLEATLLDGRRVTTNRVGWYVNRAQSVAIGDDGAWYNLLVAGSPLARWRGVSVEPSDPPLVVGLGGRDGESGDLQEFLDRVLDG